MHLKKATLIEENVTGDIFAVEHASILYNICRFSLKNFSDNDTSCVRIEVSLHTLPRGSATVSKGKCLEVGGKIEDAQQVFFESISVLLTGSTFRQSQLSITFTFLTKLIEENVTEDIFAVEHASILYGICRFSLKNFSDNDTRKHNYSSISTPVVVSGLKLAFILCREVPLLFQKIYDHGPQFWNAYSEESFLDRTLKHLGPKCFWAKINWPVFGSPTHEAC